LRKETAATRDGSFAGNVDDVSQVDQRGGGADHQFVGATFYLELEVGAVEGQQLQRQRDLDLSTFTWAELDAGEGFQFLEGAQHAFVVALDVELRHGDGGARAGIGHAEGELHRGVGGELICGEHEVGVGELRVGQAMPEGVECPTVLLRVIRVAVDRVGLARVVRGRVAGGVWEAHGEPT